MVSALEPVTETQRRVLDVVLVDEEVLSRAIEHKYEALVPSEPPAAHEPARRRLVIEHLRKLFVGHLRLGPLSGDDLAELASKFVGRVAAPSAQPVLANKTTAQGGPVPVATPAPPVPIESNAQVAAAAEAGQVAGPGDGDQAASRSAERQPLFSEDEKRILVEQCRRLRDVPGAERLGPRTVRGFVFRYQLARLLIRRLGHPVDAEVIAKYLVKASHRAAAR
jgi:hypothetical protein